MHRHTEWNQKNYIRMQRCFVTMRGYGVDSQFVHNAMIK